MQIGTILFVESIQENCASTEMESISWSRMDAKVWMQTKVILHCKKKKKKAFLQAEMVK